MAVSSALDVSKLTSRAFVYRAKKVPAENRPVQRKMQILLVVVNDLTEVSLQGSAADQTAVDVGLGKQLSRVLTIDN